MTTYHTSYERNRREITNILKTHNLNGFGVEIGVKEGEFSKHLLSNWNCKQLYLVDPWITQSSNKYDETHHNHSSDYETCKNNVQPFMGKYQFIRDFSHNAHKLFENEYFDFIYIDGNHSYEAVLEDLNDWYPKLKQNGLICGDDYTVKPIDNVFGYEFGVKKAVDEFAIKHHKNVSLDLVGDWYYSDYFNGERLLYPSRNWYFFK
uniref:Methyltransferase n=1 Tax=Pyramimonas orientalis virus TaxID=455367 RepID=A0A7M3UNR5_POV01|nr:hypothetical protein HWQ62_00207 [Pyramimonas orientalis virus]